MNTITTYTYTFSELPTQELKDAAIERHRDTNVVDTFWQDCIFDEWKDKLEDLGYSDPEISYSGFWSQGDGASFTASQVPLPSTDPDVIKAWDQLLGAAALLGVTITEDIADRAFGRIYRTSHSYSHENTVSVDWTWGSPPFENMTPDEGLEPFVEALAAAVEAYFEGLEETVRDLCREIYSDLEKSYEYLTSDEAVAESLIANEHEFEVDEEGELA